MSELTCGKSNSSPALLTVVVLLFLLVFGGGYILILFLPFLGGGYLTTELRSRSTFYQTVFDLSPEHELVVFGPSFSDFLRRAWLLCIKLWIIWTFCFIFPPP